jgi:hypothetical protein
MRYAFANAPAPSGQYRRRRAQKERHLATSGRIDLPLHFNLLWQVRPARDHSHHAIGLNTDVLLSSSRTGDDSERCASGFSGQLSG